MEYFRQPIFVIGILLCLTSICPDCHQNRQEQFTGQDIWRLEEGGILWDFLRSKYPSFPLLLEENGYFMGDAESNTGRLGLKETEFIPDPLEINTDSRGSILILLKVSVNLTWLPNLKISPQM